MRDMGQGDNKFYKGDIIKVKAYDQSSCYTVEDVYYSTDGLHYYIVRNLDDRISLRASAEFETGTKIGRV